MSALVWTPPKIAMLSHLILQGNSYSQCARYFEVSRSTIAGAVRRHITVKAPQKQAYAGANPKQETPIPERERAVG